MIPTILWSFVAFCLALGCYLHVTRRRRDKRSPSRVVPYVLGIAAGIALSSTLRSFGVLS